MLAVKPASTKQMAYIERLVEESGDTGPKISAETTSTEASKIIQRLISRQNGDINEPRLGMAMKECFRHFTSLGSRNYLDAFFGADQVARGRLDPLSSFKAITMGVDRSQTKEIYAREEKAIAEAHGISGEKN